MESASLSLVSLADCPNDVLGVIAERLPLTSWAALAQLSQRFYTFTKSSSALNKVLLFTFTLVAPFFPSDLCSGDAADRRRRRQQEGPVKGE